MTTAPAVAPLRRIILLVALVVGAVAGPAGARAADASTPPGMSWLRAVHAIPGLEGVDISLTPVGGTESEVLAERTVFGTVGEYTPVPPGDYVIALRRSGEPADAEPVLSGNVTAEASQALTLAAVGSLQEPRLATLRDDLTPPGPGSGRVRLMPAAASAPSVTVAAQDGPVIAADAVFGQATSYAEVPAGRWTLDLSSSAGDQESAVVDVASASVYTAFIVEDGSGGLTMLPVLDAAGTSGAPSGGVPTGAGGTVADGGSSTVPATLVLVGALGALVLHHRRSGREGLTAARR